jgi:hypothetical protein
VKTAQTRLGYADPTRLRRPEDDVGGLRLGFCLSRPGRSGRHRRALLQRKKPERPQAPNLCTTSAPIPPRGRSPQNPEAFTRGFESGCPDLRRARTRSGAESRSAPLKRQGACEVHEWTWPAARAGLDALRTRQNAICVPTQPRRLGNVLQQPRSPQRSQLGKPFWTVLLNWPDLEMRWSRCESALRCWSLMSPFVPRVLHEVGPNRAVARCCTAGVGGLSLAS